MPVIQDRVQTDTDSLAKNYPIASGDSFLLFKELNNAQYDLLG